MPPERHALQALGVVLALLGCLLILGRVGMRFGPPLDFSRYEGMKSDRYVLRAITDEVMYALMELGGQEYVDTYAQTAKSELARQRRHHEPAPEPLPEAS